MEHCGLRVPSHIVSADKVMQGKPHPEPYLKGAALLGLSPAECLVIEDRPPARKPDTPPGAKCWPRFILIPDSLSDADWIVDSLNEVQVRVTGDALEVRFTPSTAKPLSPPADTA